MSLINKAKVAKGFVEVAQRDWESLWWELSDDLREKYCDIGGSLEGAMIYVRKVVEKLEKQEEEG